MNPAMRFLNECLVELTGKFIDYCKDLNYKPQQRPYNLIRKNIRIAPLSKLLLTLNHVMKHKLTDETAKYAYYLKKEIAIYLHIAPAITPASNECNRCHRNMFFNRIIRKNMRREKTA